VKATQTCCTPKTCPQVGTDGNQLCGTISDGCGGQINCSCTGEYDTCGGGGVAGECGCTPLTSETGCHPGSTTDCGDNPNNCGGTYFCAC
jgi:hypothetical protein